MLRAVLFDLDDTLFDHRQCARMALSELHHAHPCFQAWTFDELARVHAGLLEELHRRVMTGEVPLDVARQERFRRLFQAAGMMADPDVVAQAAATYRDGYRMVRQPVRGAARLLEVVKRRAQVGIVSNNLLEEQQDKLRHCGLDRYVDALVVSEEAGVSKPDPGIFEIALERLGCAADEAVMVGDSWAADIIGARAAGIRAIWFNPLGKPLPGGDAGVTELRALEPAEAAMSVIFDRSTTDTTVRQELAG
jgi:putative hydrolase of the HAD superfamily